MPKEGERSAFYQIEMVLPIDGRARARTRAGANGKGFRKKRAEIFAVVRDKKTFERIGQTERQTNRHTESQAHWQTERQPGGRGVLTYIF